MGRMDRVPAGAMPGAWAPAVVVGPSSHAPSTADAMRWAGWQPVALADLPPRPWSLAGTRTLTWAAAPDVDDARGLLWAAIRGAAVVVAVDDSPVAGRLVADLARLTTVVDRSASPDPVDELTEPQCALLHALSEGHSVAEAAVELHLSKRTAHRRVTEVVLALGASSAADATKRWRDRTAVLAAPPDDQRCELIGHADVLAAAVDAARAMGPAVVHGDHGSGVSTILWHASVAVGPSLRATGLELLADVPSVASQVLGRCLADESREAVEREVRTVLGDRLLVVDDLQLVDADTTSMLQRIAEDRPLLGGWAGPGGREPWEAATAIALGSLTDDEGRQLIASLDLHLEPSECAEVLAMGGGLPGRMVELACDGDALAVAIGEAVDALAPEGADALALLAIAHDPLPAAVLDDADLDRLAASGLAGPVPGGIAPTGPTVRRLVIDRLSTDQRRTLHARAAELELDLVSRAEHLVEIGDAASARALASDALAAGPPLARSTRAFVVLARTANEDERVRELDRAVRSLLLVGHPTQAEGLLDDERRLHPELDQDPAIVAVRAGVRIQQGEVAEALALVEDALARPGLPMADEAHLRLVHSAVRLASGHDASAVAQQTEELLSDADAGAVAQDPMARLMPGVVMALSGDPHWPELLLPVFQETVAAAGDNPGMSETALASSAELVCFFVAAYGSPRGAAALLTQATDRLREVGATAWADQLRVMAGCVQFSIDGSDDATLAEVKAAALVEPAHRMTGTGWSVVALGEGDRGRFSEAAEALAAGRAVALDPIAEQSLDWVEAEIDHMRGDAEAALEKAMRIADGSATFIPTPTNAAALALWAMLQLGRDIPLEVPTAPYPTSAWVHDLDVAVRALLAGRPDDAVVATRRALDVRGVGERDVLRLRWLLGESLGRSGQAPEARRVLTELEAQLAAGSRVPLLARTRASLRALGDRRGPVGGSVGPLSGRETEMLVLVDEGLTSAEISGRLHLAVSTVDGTIRRAMVKLGAPSRRAAAAQVRHLLAASDEDLAG